MNMLPSLQDIRDAWKAGKLAGLVVGLFGCGGPEVSQLVEEMVDGSARSPIGVVYFNSETPPLGAADLLTGTLDGLAEQSPTRWGEVPGNVLRELRKAPPAPRNGGAETQQRPAGAETPPLIHRVNVPRSVARGFPVRV